MFEIVLTENAKFTLEYIFDTIEMKFGVKIADDFMEEVERTLNIIASNPEIFKQTSISEKVRVGFITKQTSFYYQIHNQSIVVLYFWDNRREPLF